MTNLFPIAGVQLEQVTLYRYLGHEAMIGKDNQFREMIRRGLTWAAFGKLEYIFRSNIPLYQERRVFKPCVLPVLICGAKNTIRMMQVAQRRKKSKSWSC